MQLQGGQVVHQFSYDTLGRLISADDPDIGPRQLLYDDANQLIQYTNGVGQSIYFGYDAAGRLTRRGENTGALQRDRLHLRLRQRRRGSEHRLPGALASCRRD